VSGNGTNPLSVPNVNRWYSTLSSVLPEGVQFAAHTSGLANVAALADGTLPAIRSILLDYEPNFDPQFTWDLAPTLSHLDQFAAACRAKGRRAVAYPTGRAIQEKPLLPYGWDYAEFLSHVDDVYPQTQHWASLGAGPWASAVQTLRNQRTRRGLDPRPIVAQITIGQGGNAIPSDAGVDRYREVAVGGLRRLYLWWSPPVQDDFAKFLGAIDD